MTANPRIMTSMPQREEIYGNICLASARAFVEAPGGPLYGASLAGRCEKSGIRGFSGLFSVLK